MPSIMHSYDRLSRRHVGVKLPGFKMLRRISLSPENRFLDRVYLHRVDNPIKDEVLVLHEHSEEPQCPLGDPIIFFSQLSPP